MLDSDSDRSNKEVKIVAKGVAALVLLVIAGIIYLFQYTAEFDPSNEHTSFIAKVGEEYLLRLGVLELSRLTT